MTAYCLFDICEVHDATAMSSYRERVRATVEAFGGRYVFVGGEVEVVEGTWRPTFPVIIEFPDLAKARAWYHSPEYRDLKRLRHESSDCRAVFMEGLAPGFA